MNLLLSLLSFFILSPDGVNTTTVADHIGKWSYKVETPDVNYKGVLEFAGEAGAYTGTLKGDGTEVKLTDIDFQNNVLTFKMNVQGYPCVVDAKIDGDSLDGAVEVEGFSMPLKATRI